MGHILVGIGGLTAKIKEIIQKIRAPIDKAVAKVVGFVADKAKALIARMKGDDKPKQEPPKNEAEHDVQVKAGLAALDEEQKKKDKDNNNALTLEEAEEAAQKVKSLYPVFKSINPIEKGGRWVFNYVASPEKEHEGLKVEVENAATLRKYEVGIYNEIKGVPGLDAHHVGQKALMKEFISGYNPDLASAILIPKVGHTIRGPKGIVSRSTTEITNARQLIERDIMELRRVYPDIPDTQLKKLIDLNEELYPSLRKDKKMNKKFLVEKLHQLVVKENVNIYKDIFNNTDVNSVSDPYWKESLSMYNSLSDDSKNIFFEILKQVGIDTVSNILALLDGVTTFDGQDDDFILLLKRKNEKINGDLQDLFLEYDEKNR